MKMPEKIELKMGTEFSLEGKDYIVVGYSETVNLEGHSVTLSAWSPLLAMEQRLKREQMGEVVEGTHKHLKRVDEEMG